MKFSDFHTGQVLQAGPLTVSEADIIAFAQAHDPQWFHMDPDAASRGKFGGVIASGWHTCAMAMRLVADTVLHGSDASASPGIAYIRWPHPVRPDDRLALRADVLDVGRSRSRDTLGKLRWRWRLINQHGHEVLDLEATTLFELTQPALAALPVFSGAES